MEGTGLVPCRATALAGAGGGEAETVTDAEDAEAVSDALVVKDNRFLAWIRTTQVPARPVQRLATSVHSLEAGS